MKKLTLTILLLSSFIFGGCALVSPFKPINSCSDVKDGGANCALITDNLEYSMSQDNKTKPSDNITNAALHTDTEVEKAELVRHLTENKVASESGNRPVMLPPASYRVFIMPYTDGARYYSGRYVYITSGKARWVAGNKVINGNSYISVDIQADVTRKPTQAEQISNITFGKPPTVKEPIVIEEKLTPKKEEPATKLKPVKHRVSAYLLNCRTLPGIDGTAIAVFEQNKILDVIDKSINWWLVNYYDQECYVNSSYLYAEPE